MTTHHAVANRQLQIVNRQSMNTNLNSPMPAARAVSGEGWAAIAGAIGSALLLAKKLLGPNPASPS